jgi:glyoxylase-like metal-dependent hydrolase (beta-lactamase superfamily II)
LENILRRAQYAGDGSFAVQERVMSLVLHPFFDPDTCSFSYVLANPGSATCVVIDPVLGYDPGTGRIDTRGADRIVECVNANGYVVEWLLETHVHADHLSAARYLKEQFICAQIGIGASVGTVQAHFAARFGVAVAADGRQFDRLFADQERICLGHACGRVMHTPGHTPACVSYVFDQFAFVGDTLFMPDYGTARCDFPGGDAALLYRSIQRIFELPDDTRMLMCHDYAPNGRDYRFLTSVAEQKRNNVHVHQEIGEAAFIALREARDVTLAAPRLLIPSVRANIDGGVLPGWVLEPHLQQRAGQGAAA